MFVSVGIKPLRFVNKGVYHQFYKSSRRTFISGGTGSSWYSSGSNSSNASTANTQFSYQSAVAYQPKDRDDPVYKNLKTSLESPTGEDNYFINAISSQDLFAGVADGVGGWATHGYDSSAISRELCKAMTDFSSFVAKNHAQYTPKQLIELAYKKIKIEKLVQVGGTTAIVAHFPPNGNMTVANLGDSWCGVFRDYKLVFQTEFQTVGFNAPYQLAIIPDHMDREAKRTGRAYIQHSPADADEYVFQLQRDDVVILATDGVTDNIDTGDIELFLHDNESGVKQNLQLTSQTFVKKVVALSKDPNFPSVFSQEMSKLSGKQYRGGKQDDITVVVVRVE